MLISAAPGQAANGTWAWAWGKGVNGGSAFGICSVAASCQAGTAGTLGGEFGGQPYGIASDAAGDTYVGVVFNTRVQKVDSAGNFGAAWGKGVNGGSAFGICTVAASCHAGLPGSLGGEMNFPEYVATDTAGNVYVADYDNNRVQKFDSSG